MVLNERRGKVSLQRGKIAHAAQLTVIDGNVRLFGLESGRLTDVF